MPAERIVLVRHGRTASNAAGRWQGHTDIPLDDEGLRQADATAAVLLPTFDDVTRVVSSDLTRAVATAAPLAAGWGLVAQTDPALREVYAGTWEGLSKDEIRQRWPQDMARWEGGEDLRIGGGERISDAGARVAAAVATHAEATEGGTLVVVAHGGVLRGAVQILLGLTYGQLPVCVLQNARWGVLVAGRSVKWRLEAWNLSADPPPSGPTGDGVQGRFRPSGESAL